MKLHIHIKKLFDAENFWVRHEKKLAKENANKARGKEEIPMRLGTSRRWHNPFGFIWWRGYRKRGLKSAQGKMLPQIMGEIKDRP